MSLSAHLVDIHEDRKPPAHLLAAHGHHMTSYRPNMATAGPSNGAANGYAQAPPESAYAPAEPWMAHHGAASHPPPPRWTSWSEEKVANLQVRLARKLGPEYVTQRPGPGGGPKLSYIEGWKVIGLANDVFGFNGWSSSIVRLETDFLDVSNDGRVSCSVTSIIRITLQDGCYHEDVGGGQCENVKGKGAALDKAKKEAVTDGIKRTLKTFGNVLGNCLYDKEYTKEIVKIRVPPAKFNVSDLERRPEFTPAGPPIANGNATAVGAAATVAARPAPTARATTEPPRPGTPLRSIYEVGNDTTMNEGYMVDENFDAEFLDGEMMEESVLVEPALGNGTGFRRVDSAPAGPGYQHRHRPDMPPPPPAPANTTSRPVGPGNVEIGDPGDGDRSSGGSITNESARAQTNNIDAAAAAARRRAAMQQGFGSNAGEHSPAPMQTRASAAATHTGPIRAPSPRIPSGGIDEVAARASQTYSTRAAKLDLQEADNGAPFQGFASARGMKRVNDEQVDGEGVDLYASPTKQSAAHFVSGSPRKALGEIAVGESAHNVPRYVHAVGGGVHFGQKRHRPA